MPGYIVVICLTVNEVTLWKTLELKNKYESDHACEYGKGTA